jgi:2,5-diamino-6-(ribosylamino)-4(3H)-pyrimidinone 5'-phosphate reductase
MSPSLNPRPKGTSITGSTDRRVRRLFPLPSASLVAEEVYQDISFPRNAVARPYVLINMVCSLDGKTAVDNRAGSIGSSIDRALMRTLRAQADAVMIGAGTLRAEKLRLDVPEDLARARVSRGLEPQPLAIVATNTGNIPLKENLLGHVPDNLVVLVSSETPKDSISALSLLATVEVVPSRAEREPATVERSVLDPIVALEMLREHYGVGLLMVEGGPTFNHALISTNLVDELFLTLSPRLLGGEKSPTILEGPNLPPSVGQALNLTSLYLADDEIFLRYTLAESRRPQAFNSAPS